MVTLWIRSTALRGIPLGRQQQAEVLLIGHLGHPREDVPKISQRIMAMAPAGDEERADDSRAIPGIRGRLIKRQFFALCAVKHKR